MQKYDETYMKEIKLYARIDEDWEDILISSLIQSAEAIVFTGTSVTRDIAEKYNSLTPLYELLIKSIVTHLYDNRGVEEGLNHKTAIKYVGTSLEMQLEAEYKRILGDMHVDS